MSTMYVNKVQELNVGSGVHIPGHPIQIVYDTKTIGNDTATQGVDIAYLNTSTVGGFSSAITVQSLNITPKYANSKILLEWTGQIRMNMSAGGGGLNGFFGKDGSNLLTVGGNANAVLFRYSGSQLSDMYQSESCRWLFTAGQTTQMTLDFRVSCYNSNASLSLSHDGIATLTATEIAV